MRFINNCPIRSVQRAAVVAPSSRITPVNAGAIFTSAATRVRTALTMGAVGLLLLVALACGDGSDESTPAQSADTERSTPSAANAPTGSTPETTVAAATRSRTEATVPAPPSGGASPTSSANAASPSPMIVPPTTGHSADPTHTPAPPPAEASLSPEQIKEAEDLYSVAEGYFGGRHHRALQSLDQAIAINPGFAQAYTLRGVTHIALRNYEDGLEDLNLAIDLEAENVAMAYAFRSYVNSKLGDYDRAIEDGEKALDAARQSEEGEGDAVAALFTAHNRLGRYEQDHDYRAFYDLRHNYGIRDEREFFRSRLGGMIAGSRFGFDPYSFAGNIQVIDTDLLLRPDDAGLYAQRAFAFLRSGFHTEAVEEYSKAFELYGDAAPAHLFELRASLYMELGEYEKAVQDLTRIDIANNLQASANLADAYLRLGRHEDALHSIDAIDYGLDAPPSRVGYGRSGRDAWLFDLPAASKGYPGHFVLKGAIYAVNGNYDEGVKYVNILDCSSKLAARQFKPHGVPAHIWDSIDWMRSRGFQRIRSDALPNLQDNEIYQEIVEWCGFPEEFVTDLEAGVWLFFMIVHGEEFSGSVGPLDPLLIAESDNLSLLRWVTALYATKTSYGSARGGSEDYERAVERVIELDPSLADTYLLDTADLYLTVYFSGREESYEKAVAAWERYESLAAPEPEVAAEHYFARGTALAELQRKEEAQAAYQKAFEYGYDEAKVREALVQLNR